MEGQDLLAGTGVWRARGLSSVNVGSMEISGPRSHCTLVEIFGPVSLTRSSGLFYATRALSISTKNSFSIINLKKKNAGNFRDSDKDKNKSRSSSTNSLDILNKVTTRLA